MARNRRSSTLAGKRHGLPREHHNYGRWTKGRFSEAVTVTGPGKMIFLAGIGAEHEQTGKVLYPGDFKAQCRYAYKKLKKVLARNGATMADVVKQVSYVTDARYQTINSDCRSEAYGDAPLPAHTFVAVSDLAWPGMLVEIDVIAMVAAEWGFASFALATALDASVLDPKIFRIGSRRSCKRPGRAPDSCLRSALRWAVLPQLV